MLMLEIMMSGIIFIKKTLKNNLLLHICNTSNKKTIFNLKLSSLFNSDIIEYIIKYI